MEFLKCHNRNALLSDGEAEIKLAARSNVWWNAKLKRLLMWSSLLVYWVDWKRARGGWISPRLQSITDIELKHEPRSPGFQACEFSPPPATPAHRPPPGLSGSQASPRVVFLSVWARDLLWHLLRAQDTVVFKNSPSPKIQQKWQNQSQGPKTVASCHLSGSVQHFRNRKLGLPGHAFCCVGSRGNQCDSRIRSLRWLSTKALETLTCPALSSAKWCLSPLPLQAPPCLLAF